MKPIKLYMAVLLSLLLFWSCATPETSADDDPERRPASPYVETVEEDADDFSLDDLDEFERLLFDNRSELTDRFDNLQHDIPEIFTREVVRDDSDRDRYAGFRVQIKTTRSVSEADETRDSFVAWADSTLYGYNPDAYVVFRQPYYRVRAGDFHDRNRAIEFSRLIKTHFPDAWVVHDRIEPDVVPSDTTDIRFREPGDMLVPIDQELIDDVLDGDG